MFSTIKNTSSLFLCLGMIFVSCSTDDFDFETQKKNNQPIDSGIDTAVDKELYFYRDVRPVIDRTCIHCHYEGGRSFDMNTHDAFVSLAEYIARDVRDGGKPPPISKKDCRSYIGDEKVITESDIVVFENWYAQGAQVGDPNDASDYIPPQQHEQPEREFDILMAIPPNYPFPNIEGHRCSVFSLNNQTPITLKSSEFFTNDTRKNWSSMLFLAPIDFSGQHGEHFDCDYSGEEDWKVLASWSPGVDPIEYGDGIVLEENATIILKQFWFPENQPFEGLTSYWGLQTSDEIPERPTQIIKYEVENFRLQANESSIEIAESSFWTGGDMEIIGGFARSSLLSKGMTFSVLSDNQNEECLISYHLYEPLVPQHVMFREPMNISNDKRIAMHCDFDNSSGNAAQFNEPPHDISQGYRNNEALCFITLYVR